MYLLRIHVLYNTEYNEAKLPLLVPPPHDREHRKYIRKPSHTAQQRQAPTQLARRCWAQYERFNVYHIYMSATKTTLCWQPSFDPRTHNHRRRQKIGRSNAAQRGRFFRSQSYLSSLNTLTLAHHVPTNIHSHTSTQRSSKRHHSLDTCVRRLPDTHTNATATRPIRYSRAHIRT